MASPFTPANGPQHSVNSYTVGWITALPDELQAAQIMLDEEHAEPYDFSQPQNDSNTYTYGRVGEHHVIITGMPRPYGTTSAATTATETTNSHPNLRFVCSSVSELVYHDPSMTFVWEMSLSAILEANPSPGANDSVSELTGHIGAPPQALQKVVTDLSTRHEREESKIPAIMEDALEKYPKLKKSKKWDRPSSETDLLFQETFYRNGDLSWKQKVGEDYRPEGQYIRPVRDDSCPVVHLGIIGSGNTLEKDVNDRERILLRMLPAEALCLEMESGGVMNVFPSLVIRGICDFGDRRKNDVWPLTRRCQIRVSLRLF
ncbi:hypothetical protein LTR49_025209 [Elasticomyces elasticus]|nr:hypothetical protein LTR49_025209 [Elasticomyces elasticus]